MLNNNLGKCLDSHDRNICVGEVLEYTGNKYSKGNYVITHISNGREASIYFSIRNLDTNNQYTVDNSNEDDTDMNPEYLNFKIIGFLYNNEIKQDRNLTEVTPENIYCLTNGDYILYDNLKWKYNKRNINLVTYNPEEKCMDIAAPDIDGDCGINFTEGMYFITEDYIPESQTLVCEPESSTLDKFTKRQLECTNVLFDKETNTVRFDYKNIHIKLIIKEVFCIPQDFFHEFPFNEVRCTVNFNNYEHDDIPFEFYSDVLGTHRYFARIRHGELPISEIIDKAKAKLNFHVIGDKCIILMKSTSDSTYTVRVSEYELVKHILANKDITVEKFIRILNRLESTIQTNTKLTW